MSFDAYPTRQHARDDAVIERMEPVIYSSPVGPGPLSVAQLTEYETRGYLILRGIYRPEEIAGFREEFNRLRRSLRASENPRIVREPDSDEVRSIFSVQSFSRFFERVSRQPRLLDAVRQILGSEVYIYQSRINLKPGLHGCSFFWHSDLETWHAEDGMPRMRALSASIPLTENTAYNGSLMVFPGSHRYFLPCPGRTPADHYRQSLRRQAIGTPGEKQLQWLYERFGIEMPIPQPGDVLLFECNLMHGSGGNISPLPRSNLFFAFNSVDNALQRPFAGVRPRPAFLAAREPVALRPLASLGALEEA